MTDDDAWHWLAVGTGLALVGLTLLRLGDAFLLVMWGTALILTGGTTAVVGTGVLLRLLR